MSDRMPREVSDALDRRAGKAPRETVDLTPSAEGYAAIVTTLLRSIDAPRDVLFTIVQTTAHLARVDRVDLIVAILADIDRTAR